MSTELNQAGAKGGIVKPEDDSCPMADGTIDRDQAGGNVDRLSPVDETKPTQKGTGLPARPEVGQHPSHVPPRLV